ncbi:DUF4350 domain-containing protein [Sphingopyxis indica]|uniref:DUF4350 domain-containing protein n=1 Tax=Sphingopyxis indica TaxID=436663 RepID=UPI0029394081|nr:DUF4350 domain-containing protein [Sphingopyxis indica]WOF43726.1 DUF4350 domain-containing protein [Sphingopyxis indica]
MSGTAANERAFDPRLIGGVIAVGIVAFIALWALIALGPDLRSGNDGKGHALSRGAPGFAGIVDLLERAGAEVELRRRPERYGGGDQPLLILTPTHQTQPGEVAELLNAQGGAPTLVILPKWYALPIPNEAEKPGWSGPAMAVPPPLRLLPEARFGAVELGPRGAGGQRVRGEVAGRAIELILPNQVQTIKGDALDTLIAAPGGGALLARAKDADLYILADPDLIDNFAFASRDKARGAALLLDAVGEDANASGFAFDLTLAGFGGGRSLLRFAFVPPFIGITLCVIATGLLALWQAWMRFGPALRPARAIPVSKAALIANSAELIAQAGRDLDGARAYVANQRGAIARRLHAPAGLDEAETDGWIDKHLPAGREPFSALARRLPLARSPHEFLEDAQALHDIRKDLLRDS